VTSSLPSLNLDYIGLTELLAHGRNAAHPVASGGGAERTWLDFVRQVAAWRTEFASRRESRFGLFHSDSWQFATALFGAWSAHKVVIVPGDAQPATLNALGADVDAFAGEFPLTLGKPVIREARLGSSCELEALGSFGVLDAGWPSLVVMTSGSTGKPSLFPKKLAQFATEMLSQERVFGDRMGRARVLGTVSHQHIYGLFYRVLWPLCAGRVFETAQLFFPEEILAHAERAEDALLVTSPAHLKRLPESGPARASRGRFRAVFSSGGALDVASAKLTFQHFRRWPLEIFGSSETGGVAFRELTREDSPWQPLPGVQIAIEPGTELLRVRSPHLWDDAWFTTSDRVRELDGGAFELLGRSDRVVKIEEKRVSLDAVEAGLRESGLVHEARVVVLDGERTELGAVIVPNARGRELLGREGKRQLNLALRAAVGRHVERTALPRRFRYVDALPENHQGKVPADALRRLFAGSRQ
jgi:acyl-coenzyme A synthetase/AMP-(fatty) acid ligase